MRKTALFASGTMLVLCGVTLSLFACAPTEQSCKLNQTAAGAVGGAAAGAVVGALISHGSAGGTLAGAALGGVVGGLVGHQGDESCRQYALQKAMDLAAAEQQRRKYQAVSWTNTTSGSHGTITPLSSRTDPATKQLCVNYTANDTVDNKQTTVTKKACRQPDGTWQ